MKFNIPGLHGGISQQSPMLRSPNQHTDVVNSVCDIVDGLRFPRPGTNLHRVIPNMSDEGIIGQIRTTNGKLWEIYRHYEAGVTDAIVVYNVELGTYYEFDVSGNSYLSYGADLRVITILDTVFLLNRNATASVDQVIPDWSSTITDEPTGFVYIAQTFPTYSFNATMQIKTTVRPTPLFVAEGTTLATAGLAGTVAAGVTDPAVPAGVIAGHASTAYSVGIQFGGTVGIQLTGARVTNGGNVYECNVTNLGQPTTEPGVGADWMDYWHLVSATPTIHTYPAWSSGSAYMSLADVKLTKPEILLEYSPTDSQHPMKTYSAKQELEPLSGVTYAVTLAPSYEELPPFITSRFSHAVTFKLADHYFVRFDSDTASYEECPAPGQSYALDPTSMPYELKYGGVAWTLDTGAWDTTPRYVGDSVSAPLPGFVGRTINDMFYHRGRLCFLSDNYVVMSSTSGEYNFFPKTATEVVDDDPISVFPSSLGYHELLWAKPFSKQLLLFSSRKQYVLHSGFESLTPKTVAIDESTAFHMLPAIEPELMESSMLLPIDNGSFAGIMEYKLSEQEIAADGLDLTEAVPRLIPSDITGVEYVPSASVALVWKRGSDEVFCYRFHRQIDGSLTQVSWVRWVFPHVIHSIKTYESDKVWIVLKDGGSYNWTSMNLGEMYDSVPLDYRQYSSVTTDVTVDSGYIVVDTSSFKEWDNGEHPNPGVSTDVVTGIPIVAYATLSPLIMRDQKGLPRSDISATIQNMQIDWLGGEFGVTIQGQGIPTRTTYVTPIEYTEVACDPGESYKEPTPTRVLVMYPASRATITLEHRGTQVTRINNISMNLEVRKDWG